MVSFHRNYTTSRKDCQVEKVSQTKIYLTEIAGYEGATKLASDWNEKHPVPKEHLGNLFLKLYDYEKDPIYNGVRPAARSVLALIIADTIGCNKWEAWISRSKFERFTGYSNATITQALQFLEDNDYIKSHYVCKKCYLKGELHKIERSYEFRWWGNAHSHSSFGWVPSEKRCPSCGTNLWAPKAVLRIYSLDIPREILEYFNTPYALLDCLSADFTLLDALKVLTSKLSLPFGISHSIRIEDRINNIYSVKGFLDIESERWNGKTIPKSFEFYETCWLWTRVVWEIGAFDPES